MVATLRNPNSYQKRLGKKHSWRMTFQKSPPGNDGKSELKLCGASGETQYRMKKCRRSRLKVGGSW